MSLKTGNYIIWLSVKTEVDKLPHNDIITVCQTKNIQNLELLFNYNKA